LAQVINAQVLESTVIDESVLLRLLLLLRRAGRIVALPALEWLELLLDAATPPAVKMMVLSALTYLLMPVDLMPDFIPVAGFSDDLVALTSLLSLCGRHRSPAIRLRAKRRLDRWCPPGR
jgi:uncharacterized membrane protein YkvA (DUF1232 family)